MKTRVKLSTLLGIFVVVVAFVVATIVGVNSMAAENTTANTVENIMAKEDTSANTVENNTKTETVNNTVYNYDLLNGYVDEELFYDELETLAYYCCARVNSNVDENTQRTIMKDTVSVVFNRVLSKNYPNTVAEVVDELDKSVTENMETMTDVPTNYDLALETISDLLYNGWESTEGEPTF